MSEPKRFRKKPVVVEAMQLQVPVIVPVIKVPDQWREVWRWITDHGVIARIHPANLTVHTLEGVMTADPGDWIIRGVKGEFYPIKDEIFRATYESVDA